MTTMLRALAIAAVTSAVSLPASAEQASGANAAPSQPAASNAAAASKPVAMPQFIQEDTNNCMEEAPASTS